MANRNTFLTNLVCEITVCEELVMYSEQGKVNCTNKNKNEKKFGFIKKSINKIYERSVKKNMNVQLARKKFLEKTYSCVYK